MESRMQWCVSSSVVNSIHLRHTHQEATPASPCHKSHIFARSKPMHSMYGPRLTSLVVACRLWDPTTHQRSKHFRQGQGWQMGRPNIQAPQGQGCKGPRCGRLWSPPLQTPWMLKGLASARCRGQVGSNLAACCARFDLTSAALHHSSTCTNLVHHECDSLCQMIPRQVTISWGVQLFCAAEGVVASCGGPLQVSMYRTSTG